MMVARSILVAFDFSAPSRRALTWARMLHARLHAAVTVVHVDADPFTRSEERLRQLELDLRREIADVFGPEEQVVKTIVVHGRPAATIAELARDQGVDLVIAASTGKNTVDRLLLGSTTHALMRTLSIPLLTVQ